MIIRGKDIAESVYTRLGNRTLDLGILVAGTDPVTDSFVRSKERAAKRLGVTVVRKVIPESATTDDALQALEELAASTDGVIVQLPLPETLDTETILAAIPPEKDVDGISAAPRVRPPVAGALEEILRVAEVSIPGSRAMVVGSGRLVGKPCADFLRDSGAEVTVVGKGDSLDALRAADIVVLGAGQPRMIRPEHVRRGAVLVDAGTSESKGRVVGDADSACAEKAAVFTPVPGGVGPIAVSMIFKNLFELTS